LIFFILAVWRAFTSSIGASGRLQVLPFVCHANQGDARADESLDSAPTRAH